MPKKGKGSETLKVQLGQVRGWSGVDTRVKEECVQVIHENLGHRGPPGSELMREKWEQASWAETHRSFLQEEGGFPLHFCPKWWPSEWCKTSLGWHQHREHTSTTSRGKLSLFQIFLDSRLLWREAASPEPSHYFLNLWLQTRPCHHFPESIQTGPRKPSTHLTRLRLIWWARKEDSANYRLILGSVSYQFRS